MCPACRMLLSCCANSRKRCMLKYGNNHRATALLSTRRHGVLLCAARWWRRRSWLRARMRRRVRRYRAASGVVADRRGYTSKIRPKSEFMSARQALSPPSTSGRDRQPRGGGRFRIVFWEPPTAPALASTTSPNSPIQRMWRRLQP